MNHPIGTLTNRSDIDLGRVCDIHCEHCYHRWTPKEECRWQSDEVIHARMGTIDRAGRDYIDITGGEPTLHPKLSEFISWASQQEIMCRVITHGRHLVKKWDSLIQAGMHDLLFSVNGPEPIHDMAAGVPGQHKAICEAMQFVKEQGFSFSANTVITSRTVHCLRKNAEQLIQYVPALRMVNFIGFNPYYGWKSEHQEEGNDLTPRYKDTAKALIPAVKMLTAAGVAVNIRYVPYCSIPTLTKHVVNIFGNRFDPYEWRSPREQSVQQVQDSMRSSCNNHSAFGSPCESCSAKAICDGVHKTYLSRHGWGEFTSISGPTISGSDPVYWRKKNPESFVMKEKAFDL